MTENKINWGLWRVRNDRASQSAALHWPGGPVSASVAVSFDNGRGDPEPSVWEQSGSVPRPGPRVARVHRIQIGGKQMRYIVTTPKTVEQATADLDATVKANGFGVLHTYDLKQTLHNKGVDLPQECRILEVCNPQQAARVLGTDMEMNLALPCRISVYEKDGETHIGMIRPTAMLASLSEAPELAKIAEEVERATVKMIDEAC
jgi:uncharacterized protein (DUF302 family)